jgi:hypothetical protein
MQTSNSPKNLEGLLADAIQGIRDLRDATKKDPSPRSGREDIGTDLPTVLYAVLSNPQFEDAVSWMPHGYAWKIKDLNLFVSKVLPLFVDSGTYPENFNNFVSLLTSFGFNQVTRGPDASAYYHEVRKSPNVTY